MTTFKHLFSTVKTLLSFAFTPHPLTKRDALRLADVWEISFLFPITQQILLLLDELLHPDYSDWLGLQRRLSMLELEQTLLVSLYYFDVDFQRMSQKVQVQRGGSTMNVDSALTSLFSDGIQLELYAAEFDVLPELEENLFDMQTMKVWLWVNSV